MRNKRFMLIAILILAVGFASVSTVLYITGNLAIATSDEFDVYFSGAILDNEDKSNELIKDKKHIVYKTKELKKVNDESVLEYEVTNGSTQYDADVTINCTPNSTDYYEVITTPSSLTVEAGHVETGIVTVKQKKYSTEVIEEEFECELVANAVERTSTGDDVATASTYAIEGILKDQDGNELPNTNLVVYSNTPHEVTTDRNGYFYVDGLEKGIHEIYLKTDADINDKEATKNASSFGATLTTNDIYKVTKGNYEIDSHNAGIDIEDKSNYCEYKIGYEWKFDYTGKEENFVTPCEGIYKVETWGAQGGGNGGAGGYATGTIKMTKDQVVYIVVGGQGRRNGGGYNGGGSGQYKAGSVSPAGWGGGGATHMAKTNRGVLSNYSSYKNEVYLVGGAGGGAGENGSVGGSGGGTNGGGGSGSCYVGGGGSQSGGGRAGDTDATCGGFGTGGCAPEGSSKSGTYGAGGGGAGWYGGGASSYSSGSNCAGGGGGGSGYIGGVTGGSMSNGQRLGNGYARITLISID